MNDQVFPQNSKPTRQQRDIQMDRLQDSAERAMRINAARISETPRGTPSQKPNHWKRGR